MDNDQKIPGEGQPDQDEKNPLTNLYEIVSDLWGQGLSDRLQAHNQAVQNMPEVQLPKADMPPAPAPKKEATPAEKEQAPKAPPFESFWKMADESVDWTDVLVHEQPNDSIYSPEHWAFLRQEAEHVLNGDLESYARVLREEAPLEDLQDYTDGCRFTIHNAGRLTVRFTPREDWLQADETALRRYLSGLALRCARDTMALLPLETVTVLAATEEQTLLEVTFPRSVLRKNCFCFVDPEALVLSNGGCFTL